MRSVEEVRNFLYSKMSSNGKFAFLCVFFCGLSTHGFMLLNKIPFYDDIGLLFHTGGTYKNGRWFLGIIGALEYRLLGGNYSTTMVKGIIAILFIGLSCALLVSLFKIEKKITIFIFSCIMIVYPAVTVIFAYMFMAQCFAIALFLGTLAVYLTVRVPKYGGVLGIGCICLSLGLYQAYFAIPCVLFLVLLLCDIFEGTDAKKVFITAVKYLFTLGMGMVVYFVVNNFFLIVMRAELTKYQGISDMGQITVADILGRIQNAYSKFLLLPFGDFQGMNASILIKVIFGLSIIMSAVIIGIYVVRTKDILNRIMLVGMTALLPLAVNIIYVMCDENTVYIHGLMIYASVFVLLIPTILLNCHINNSGEQDKGFSIIMEWGTVVASLIAILYYIGFNNVAYLQADLLQSQVDTYCTVFISEIKGTDGYKDEYPIILVQDEERDVRFDFNDKSMYLMKQFKQLSMTAYDTTMLSWMNKYSLPEYLMYRMGFETENMKDYGQLLKEGAIEELDFIDEMPCYPDDGSMRVVDDKIIVKLSDY